MEIQERNVLAESEWEERWSKMTQEESDEYFKKIFKIPWDENHCCPYFTVVDCTATEEQKHVACKLSLCEDGSMGIDNAWAVFECLGPHHWDCPIKEQLTAPLPGCPGRGRWWHRLSREGQVAVLERMRVGRAKARARREAEAKAAKKEVDRGPSTAEN